ncbi:MAG: hypothetical protein JW910_03825 [Anaerolineae bacterium]|nr:hypothetical protein [Anaerolineae bacterium]
MNRIRSTQPVVAGYSTDYMTTYLERVAVWHDGTTEVEHATRYRNRRERLAWEPGFADAPIGTGKRVKLPEAC